MAGLLDFEVPGGLTLWDYVKQRANDPLVPPPTSKMIQNEWINKGMEAIGLAPLGITKYEQALEVARKNAVKMLGLPENNTAMDRARAMGFDLDVYHGTPKNFDAFDLKKLGTTTAGPDATEGIFTANNPKIANEFIWGNGSPYGGNVMPLKIKTQDPVKVKTVLDGTTGTEVAKLLQQAKRAKYDRVDFDTNMLGAEGLSHVVFDPKNIRSRFAAFDPARAAENDLLAGLAPYLGIGSLLGLGYYGD